MAPGFYGADVEQLKALSKSMGLAGSRLKNTEMQVNSLVSGAAWKGEDSERFRREWSNELRPLLHRATQSLDDASKVLLQNAKEQQDASVAAGGASGGASGGGGSAGGSGNNGWLSGLPGAVVGVAGTQPWFWSNAAATTAGLATDKILDTMWKGDLLKKVTNWPFLEAQYAEKAGVGYVKGTQVLNGTSMLGRLSGGLGVVTGGMQIIDGFQKHDTGVIVDGTVSTILAGGSLVPGVGPFFAVAGIAWGGLSLLASSNGYGSTTEMLGDWGKHIGEGAASAANAVADGAKNAVNAVADGAKKVWGWLGG
ncbi:MULTISPECIES: hypothetical protein [Arthrobacter]|uniref:WXG100 family type VII secretion target n=2 Tax=Arthrobacter TaxID=1663 RepID=A0ABU9KK59_9MICC|nr:hypothetical protein [Arthrobacter sp. YJM1]MDP5227047.1 hypothetical protein [Arthrobacter sp. YJM1]